MSITHALVVDSSKTSRIELLKLLSDAGVVAEFAKSEAQGWNLLEDRHQLYDIVFLVDSAISKGNETFVARFRAMHGYSSTPLIFLTSSQSDEDEAQSLYKIGFTQIFNRQESEQLASYIKQVQDRNTFEKAHENQVLIIEDDRALQLTVQAILEENNCECFCFASAEEALAQNEVTSPDMIATDFFLEGKMTGMDFIMKIRNENHPWKQVPVMVMTGLDDETRKYELVRSGANDYIVKPIDPVDLTVRVENLLRYKHLLDKVEQQRQEMQYLAMHDQLTGLYNRYFVAEQVHIGIAEAIRHKTAYSLIILDVDFFKQINDKHGHDVGDEVLQSIGSFLLQRVRGNDVVARLGGEEFLILLSYCDLEGAKDKAESLRVGLESLEPAGLVVTGSFGVAQLSEKMNNFDSLFKAADQAVYSAKQKGRNQVQTSTAIKS